MYTPKEDIFKLLSQLEAEVLQPNQNVFKKLPTITFYVANNSINLDLDNEITNQDIAIVIDIWTKDSITSSVLLKDTEALMRSIGYRLTFSADIPEQDLYHTTTRFEN
jgi:hypothetical protein